MIWEPETLKKLAAELSIRFKIYEICGEQNKPTIIQEEAVNGLLHHLDTHKSMGLDGIHPRALRELAEELAKPLSIIYQQS